MKTLKSKIFSPLLLLLITVPLVTLILFNITLKVYVEKTARTELKATTKSLETLARRELDKGMDLENSEKIENSFYKLTTAIQASKLIVNTKLLIYNGRQQLVYPQKDISSPNYLELTKEIELKLTSARSGKVEEIQIGRTKYLMTASHLNDSRRSWLTIVLVTQVGAANNLIRTVNMFLIIIMISGIGFGVFFTDRMTNRMVAYVRQLCGITEKIGNGDFALANWKAPDIIEFNTLYKSIENMSAHLEAYDMTQRTFLQNASHELRTPLMSIQGYAEGISEGIITDTKQAADIIKDESLRLKSLVDELLTLSRLESQTYCKELVTVNLCELLPEYTQRLGGIAVKENKAIKLTLPDFPVLIKADESLLLQTVTNIISNCLRYTTSVVNIIVLIEGDLAIIKISDDGDGISEEDLPHIFERFFRGKNGNSGLGLAIAKSAVTNLGGNIKAFNSEKGAVFEIALPLCK